MQLLELTIDDTSPLISYSPFRDTLSTPNLTNGWNPYYASPGFATSMGQVGMGDSYHITYMDGASLSLTWNGNGIRLLGNITSCSYSVTLDGADFKPNASLSNHTLVDIFDLQYGVHTLALTTRISQSQTPRSSSLVFDQAVIRTVAHGASSDFIFIQHPLDRNGVSFNGRWSFGSLSQGKTFHVSTTPGDRASAIFNGTAFVLQGMTTPEAGNYSVTLDGVTTKLSAQSSFTVPNTTLFFATGLNDSVIHSVEVTNDGGKLSLLENGFWTVVAFSGPNLSPDARVKTNISNTYSGGTVAAFALAGILFAIIATLGLFFIWRKRKRRRNNLESRTWDDKNYVTYTSKPGYGGPLSWRSRRRTRASSDFASFGAKGDTITLESGAGAQMEGSRSLRSGRNEFSIWQHDAVEGNPQGISLPILFKHSAESEFATSSEAVSPESKHPYSVYDPMSNRDRFSEMKNGSSAQDDIDLTSVALTNLKNKGKARQITGAGSMIEERPIESGSRLSFSPNDLLQGLHLKMSSGKNSSKSKTSPGSLTLSLNPSNSPVPGQRSRLRNSFLSSFQAASNPPARGQETQRSPSTASPTETLPSVPRSVSDSYSNTIIPCHQQNSRRYLLDDQPELDEPHESGGEPDSHESLPPPPHAYRNQGNTRDSGLQKSIPPNPLSLRQVVRSLSPRISVMGKDYSNLNIEHLYPETLGEDQSTLEEDQLLTIKAPSTPSIRDSLSSVHFAASAPSLAPLPSPMGHLPVVKSNDKRADDDIVGPPTQAELDGRKLSPILPSLKRTSPFNIWFDWQSERQSKRVSDSSRLRVPHFDSREDFLQGSSRNPFRLTPLTMKRSPSMQSHAPSQMSTDIVTSFLDFTNSSDDSSIRTNSFSIQSASESRIFGEPSTHLAQGGRMAELKSRWSDTTASTKRRDSSSADKSSRRKTYHTSMMPPPIYVTSEIESKTPAQRQSDSTMFSTENPMHVHPITSDVESHRNSLPSQRAPSDTLFRTGGSEETSGTRSRRESYNQFHARLLRASRYPPLPEGNDEASTTSSVHLPNPPS